MNYINTSTGEYPITQGQMRALHPSTLFPEPFEPVDGYALVQFGTTPAFDADTHACDEVAPVLDGDAWVQAFALRPLNSAEIEARLTAQKSHLLDAATAQRWTVETGGITVAGGMRIATGIDDQSRITSVIANAQLAGVERVDFKAANGWVSLTLADVQAVAAAIALHVQACFAAERAHHEAIAALETLAEARAYSVQTGWPE